MRLVLAEEGRASVLELEVDREFVCLSLGYSLSDVSELLSDLYLLFLVPLLLCLFLFGVLRYFDVLGFVRVDVVL